MAPPPNRPSPADYFFANNQNTILMGTFAAQVVHHQYIRTSQPVIESRTAFPRYLRAGLGWGAVFIGLLTQITLAKRALPSKKGFKVEKLRFHELWIQSYDLLQKITMSADFWAGYISGAAGILIGNPLDLIKVRIQAGNSSLASSPTSYRSHFSSVQSLTRGSTAPILCYGALNALLFVTYKRTSSLLTPADTTPNLWTTWTAGAVGGLATWIVSTPTELVKCKAQISSSPTAASSWGIVKEIIRTEGARGLYFGGVVTALRDSIGYGFYFWSYEISTRLLSSKLVHRSGSTEEAAKVLLCGGLAGVATWASIFPLDVIKTRVQTQVLENEGTPLLNGELSARRLGAFEIIQNTYRVEGLGAFFKGLGICSVRAFIVNAAQWAVYEYIMRELDSSRRGLRAESVKQ